MLVREYTDADLGRINSIHAESGSTYKLPSLSSEEFFSRRVYGSGDEIGLAAFMRLTAEVILVRDASWRNPAWRMEAIRQLNTVGCADAQRQGVKEVFLFSDSGSSGKRLRGLGWDRYSSKEWNCFTHKVV